MPVATRARPRPSSVERRCGGRSRRSSDDERGAGGRRLGRRAERGEDPVVLGRQADRDPEAVLATPDDEALRLELVRRGRCPDEDEVPGDGGQSKPAASERVAHPLPLGDRLLDVEPRVAQRGGGDPRRRGGDGRGVAAPVELAGDLRRGDRVADAERREAERLRERPDRDQVRRLAISGTTVLPPYSKYASSTTTAASGMRPRERRDLLGLDQLAGRVVRVADPDQVGARPGRRSPRRPRSRSRSRTRG